MDWSVGRDSCSVVVAMAVVGGGGEEAEPN